VTVGAEYPAKILVVDDEADLEVLMRQRMRRSIRRGQFDFVFARNGVEALERLRESSFDVVLSDINMPEMDGLTLLQQIPDVDPEVRLVIVTAYGDIDNIRSAMNRGAYDFITKPIDFKDLRATLERALEHRALLRNATQASVDSTSPSANDRREMAGAPVLIHMERDGMYADDADESKPPTTSGIKLSVLNATPEGAVVVALDGRVDANTMQRFERAVEVLTKGCEAAMILDCRNLDYISSAGLRVVLALAKTLRQNGAELGICAVSEPVRKVFNVSGFDQIIPVRDTQAEAVAACTS
jgi:anti-anti-sigma factor